MQVHVILHTSVYMQSVILHVLSKMYEIIFCRVMNAHAQ